MQLRQVEYFLALCEELNFTRAARRCQVSQPSLTNAIMALEAEFSGQLFHRKPSVQLTVLGQTVRPHMTRIRLNVERALDAAGDLRIRQRFLHETDIRVEAIEDNRDALLETSPAGAAMPYPVDTD